ncbi:TPA: malto-oligosyltrehalose synthase [Burkholderia vietnamiensis]|uniref:Malto-oligosyltrehalose synthase n=1 Tax=Burkholderia vietnamiensis TaxID=60552 RepID=A0AA45BAN8_BURVI|nr:malto-oligosyltrehalose synthase [Burkholderia vietnamiensis]KVS16823.1 maltooligosyl trehalose synthase [Burkholderia vietnamiensis]MCA8208545.1 malto-oligosyltrehalose synthase [Burkholderia vietnamiensis]PRH38952.1 malto-oligosyltrehalose synthase [Burkholderia vietnamiensis]HDR9099744.1 malto-oligosyltrehalose synthase [Burkholderia vietnamiensis]HDR9119445.1 malto-oligosyltrehalose synthase [Burkholderia vietnamiensis]
MTPRATLRVQLHAGFTFDDAAAQADYFARLGVSHLYLSPITTAEPGSLHGYDTVDHRAISAELGGEAGFERLVEALRARGLGVIVDIVPNHMGVGGASNHWWNDVLEWGPASPYAHYFDIDWHPPDAALDGKVLLPCLGAPYGDALAAGDITLDVDPQTGRFFFACPGRTLPVAAATYAEILRIANRADLNALAERFAAAPLRGSARLAQAHAALRDYAAEHGAHAFDAVLRGVDPRRARSRACLHHLLEGQHYRLAWWRTAADELNWRRFFDIATLAAVRVEDEAVFDAVHALPLALHAAGLVDGLRVDHVDGLADPRAYCRRLHARIAVQRDERPFLVVEKILAPGETLPDDWHADGTTGYDFMNDVAALLHDPAGATPLAAHWAAVSGSTRTFADEAIAGKRRVLARQLAGEHARLARALHRIARAAPATRDISRNALHRVLGELAVHLPVYRMYPALGDEPGDADRRVLERAYDAARAAIDPSDRYALERAAAWLGLPGIRVPRADPAALLAVRVAFAQLSAPLAAKGVEDTANYRYGRLLSRNEVGADAGDFSLSRGAFHARNRRRARSVPRTLVATATHDHKRGEDARARLAVLSEVPDAWRAVSLDWSALNQPHRGAAHRDLAWTPGPAAEAMLYQTLVGCWPPTLAPDDAAGVAALAERVVGWQTKALREAKQHTDWLAPDADYERASEQFVRAILTPRGAGDFLHRLHAFVARIAPAGVVNSLAQVALRIASPGVPDLYQGTELWDHSLVDPDNRREVPFAQLAAEPVDRPVAAYLRDWPDARVKRALIERMLALRAHRPATFADGAYVPLRVRGPLGRHAVAFARRDDTATVVVVVTRLACRLLGDMPGLPRIEPREWGDTAVVLPPMAGEPWLDCLNSGGAVETHDGMLRLDRCLSALPVAVVVATRGRG